MKKFYIAKEQLFHAIDLYIDGELIICALTLAGAAEEILGKLVDKNGTPNSLSDKLNDLCSIHNLVFGEDTLEEDKKMYADLSNKARNNLKHGVDDYNPINGIDYEAFSMIERACINYVRYTGKIEPKFRDAFNVRSKRVAIEC